ncbi:MAG: glutamine synthetase [Chloroflexi bacterium]|jgi:glutamine synthetase|nr:glutamine synthetase [Chloroflexota bacterium]
MVYIAEYIWIDGTEPTAKLRSKAQVLADGKEPGIWGFDGSSTNQAAGDQSDVVLNPVLVVNDPIRGGANKLVMCETLLTDMTPHPSNTRAKAAASAEQFGDMDTWFGLEQEYTFFEGNSPLGWPDNGFPAPQGGYYCGVGSDEIFGREVVNAHLEACIEAGLHISGINAEVMPGQWEFQIGPVAAPLIGDEMWLARWLLYRIAEDYLGPKGMPISATLDPKPVAGDWNGAGCHTNFSTIAMRESFDACVAAAEALGAPGKPELHIANYGPGVELRLTGAHETQRFDEFSFGVSDRGASIRIPWQVEKAGKGYIEDRRPNANVDPYVVAQLIIDTVCTAASK